MKKKQRLISKAVVGDNLESEVTPFSFAVQSGAGEELRGAAHAYTPDVTAKIFQILDENERCSINITSIICNIYHCLPFREEGFRGVVEQFLVMEYGLSFVVIRVAVHSG